jgi:hypothetical protein
MQRCLQINEKEEQTTREGARGKLWGNVRVRRRVENPSNGGWRVRQVTHEAAFLPSRKLWKFAWQFKASKLCESRLKFKYLNHGNVGTP